MAARPYLALIALAGTIIGGAVAARAEGSPYPLPSAPAANAGPVTPGATHEHKGWLKRALAQVNLSPSQRTQIRAMMASYRASRTTATRMTRRQLIANIRGVLTPSQVAQFDSMRPKHRIHARNRAGASALPAPVPSATPTAN